MKKEWKVTNRRVYGKRDLRVQMVKLPNGQEVAADSFDGQRELRRRALARSARRVK